MLGGVDRGMPVALHHQGTAVGVAQLDRDVEVGEAELQQLGGAEGSDLAGA